MASFNLFLFLYVMYTTCWICKGLLKERLVSDNFAPADVLQYQLVILGKANLTNKQELVCGAGYIALDKVLTAAQCFIDEEGNHKALTFSVIAGKKKLDLEKLENEEIYIHLIFLVSEGPFSKNDISVALLNKPFDSAKHPYLKELAIPRKYQTFWNRQGYIAGHGFYSAETEFINNGPKLKRVGGKSDGELRFLKVRIMFEKSCIGIHKGYSDLNTLCALPLDVSNGQFWGICENDTGSPLFIANKVVGVATAGHPDCDDTNLGGLYTEVAVYEDFIRAILDNKPLESTIIYPNRPHHLE